MKKLISTILLILSAGLFYSYAQCSFTPTITPPQPILCPGGTDTLWTEPYDSYQWYKGNTLIAGATNQYYVVTENDLVMKFKVDATFEGCTEMSESVLVDGYVFLLPYVIHSGDLGYFDPNTQTTILCPDDTLILTLGLPYAVNVQWYDGGVPIPGANDPVYYVVAPGSYTACGAPEVCPDIQCLGVTIDVTVTTPTPVITQSNDTLFSTSANSYQWYFNGIIIPGGTGQYLLPATSGSYTVMIVDQYGCSGISDPFDFVATGSGLLSIGKPGPEGYPNPADDYFILHFKELFHGELIVYDASGKEIHREELKNSLTRTLPVSSWMKGFYTCKLTSGENIYMVKFVKN